MSDWKEKFNPSALRISTGIHKNVSKRFIGPVDQSDSPILSVKMSIVPVAHWLANISWIYYFSTTHWKRNRLSFRPPLCVASYSSGDTFYKRLQTDALLITRVITLAKWGKFYRIYFANFFVFFFFCRFRPNNNSLCFSLLEPLCRGTFLS